MKAIDFSKVPYGSESSILKNSLQPVENVGNLSAVDMNLMQWKTFVNLLLLGCVAIVVWHEWDSYIEEKKKHMKSIGRQQ